MADKAKHTDDQADNADLMDDEGSDREVKYYRVDWAEDRPCGRPRGYRGVREVKRPRPTPSPRKSGPMFTEPDHSRSDSAQDDDGFGREYNGPDGDEQPHQANGNANSRARQARTGSSSTSSTSRKRTTRRQWESLPKAIRYIAPRSRDPDDNGALLAETFTLPYKGGNTPDGDYPPVPSGMGQVWLQGQTRLTSNMVTELLVIDAAESLVVEGERILVTLYCRKHAAYATTISKRQIHWLHVQHTAEVISTIKSLITSCPHINSGYKTLALGLVDRISPVDDEASGDAHPGRQTREIVARSDGEPPDGDACKAQTVTLVSTPYFIFQEERAEPPDRDATQILHSTRHGYSERQGNRRAQVLSETQKWLGEDMVHVGHLRSLLIGPDVLLSWGELPLSALRSDNILVDDGDLFSRIMVRTDGSQEVFWYFSSVKRDISLAELNAQITSLTHIDQFDITEDVPEAPVMSPEQWAKLLAFASTNLTDIHLVLWPRPAGISSDLVSCPRRTLSFSRSESPGHTNRTIHITQASRGRGKQLKPGTTHDGKKSRPNSLSEHVQSSRPITSLARRQSLSQLHSVETRRARAFGSRSPRPHQSRSTGPPPEPWLSDKVVNDQSAARDGCVYHLSSFESDNEVAAESESTARCRRSADAIRIDDELGSGEATERSGKSRPSRPPHSDKPVDTQDTLGNLESQMTPFLLWRVSRDDKGGKQDESNHGSLITMFKVLRSIDRSLKKSAEYGKVYQGGYRCSLDSLGKRHENLKANTATSDKIPPEVPKAPGDKSAEARSSGSGSGSDLDATSITSSDVGNDIYINNIELANNVMNDIFTHSESIMGFYIPIHEVAQRADIIEGMERYWGALDVVFRLLRLAALSDTTEGDQYWTIRGSCRSHGEGAATDNCEACDDGTEYTLTDALEHLHAGNAPSHTHHVCMMPSEDPCTVWLENTRRPARGESFMTLLDLLRDFADDLNKIAKLARALQLFVARPGAGTPAQTDDHDGRKRSGNGPDKSNYRNERCDEGKHPPRVTNTGKHGQSRGITTTTTTTTTTGGQRPTPPGLPPSLFHSFRNILLLFTIQARLTLLTSRRSKDTENWRRLTQNAGAAYIVVESQLTQLLERSQQELIQGFAAKDSKTVRRYGNMGTEHIAGMVVANVQAGIFCLVAAGPSQAAPPRMLSAAAGGNPRRATTGGSLSWAYDAEAEGGKETRDRTDGGGSETVMSLDLMALYREHARALTSSATLYPQRQAFLAIHAFEDELRAVRQICRRQLYCLDHLLDVTVPRSFRVTDRARQVNYEREAWALEPYRRRRMADLYNLWAMLDWMANLRLTVVERIEVLDEGHGKAIRVFTMVTLFFLPLSFVTSFFGMNTADVRDMTYSSSLYWAIAAPATLSVLGMAYMYGYKWETLTRRVKRKTWLEEGLMPASGGGSRGRGRGRGRGWKGGLDRARLAAPGALRRRFFGRNTTADDSRR